MDCECTETQMDLDLWALRQILWRLVQSLTLSLGRELKVEKQWGKQRSAWLQMWDWGKDCFRQASLQHMNELTTEFYICQEVRFNLVYLKRCMTAFTWCRFQADSLFLNLLNSMIKLCSPQQASTVLVVVTGFETTQMWHILKVE